MTHVSFVSCLCARVCFLTRNQSNSEATAKIVFVLIYFFFDNLCIARRIMGDDIVDTVGQ